MAEVLATIPVSQKGWTDLAEIRALGTRWLRRQDESSSRASR
ncbi:MAG: hypothetical protein ACR2GH_11990 [Pseudonocardia sp.]